MECVEIREITPETGHGLQLSAEPFLTALSKQYEERGLARSARLNAEEQIRREDETAKLDPVSYRLSALSDAAINGCYRRGKDVMEASDLVRYFRETRLEKTRGVDFDGNTGMDVCAEESEDEPVRAVAALQTEKRLSTRARERIVGLPAELKRGMAVWFNGARAEACAERKPFPFSALASIVAVAICLMLIVASSIMTTRAENRVSTLQKEVDAAALEVSELQSDFEMCYDLLEIRRIAVEEYGMVSEEYLKSHFASIGSEDSVESFEPDRDDSVSLGAILSAIGWK